MGTLSNLPSKSHFPPFQAASRDEVGQALRRLLGSYPAGKPSDPEVYVAAITTVLMHYPADVIARVTDPYNGLPSRQKFLPSAAELKESLEAAMSDHYLEECQRRKRAWLREEEREPVTDETRKRVGEMMEELKRKLSA